MPIGHQIINTFVPIAQIQGYNKATSNQHGSHSNQVYSDVPMVPVPQNTDVLHQSFGWCLHYI